MLPSEDGDGDDVQLDGGDDGVDFPHREGISPADFSLPEISFLSGVFRPVEVAVSPRDYSLELRFSGRRSTRRRGGQRGLWAPSPQGGAARPGPAPAYGGPMAALLGLPFWLAPSSGKIRTSVYFPSIVDLQKYGILTMLFPAEF